MQILGDNILKGNSYAASVKEEKKLPRSNL